MRIVLATVAVVAASPAFPDERLDTCSHVADLSRSVMEARQSGARADKMIKSILPAVPAQSQEMMTAIILDAFSEP